MQILIPNIRTRFSVLIRHLCPQDLRLQELVVHLVVLLLLEALHRWALRTRLVLQLLHRTRTCRILGGEQIIEIGLHLMWNELFIYCIIECIITLSEWCGVCLGLVQAFFPIAESCFINLCGNSERSVIRFMSNDFIGVRGWSLPTEESSNM